MFGQENFTSYQDYTDHIKWMWEEGYINKLEEVRYSNGELSRDITYRLLTEEEYNKKFNG